MATQFACPNCYHVHLASSGECRYGLGYGAQCYCTHVYEKEKEPTFSELKLAIINYLDNRPDDEQGTRKEWAAFAPIKEKLETLLGVEAGRWG